MPGAVQPSGRSLRHLIYTIAGLVEERGSGLRSLTDPELGMSSDCLRRTSQWGHAAEDGPKTNSDAIGAPPVAGSLMACSQERIT